MKRRVRTLALVALLVNCCAIEALADREPGKFYHLKRYAAQIPVDDTAKPRRNLFKLPELQKPLVGLLGARYLRLLRAFHLQTPAEVVNGMNGGTATSFLVMYGAQKPTLGDDAALVVIDLFDKDGALYVGFERGGVREWHSSKGKAERDLPAEILARLTSEE